MITDTGGRYAEPGRPFGGELRRIEPFVSRDWAVRRLAVAPFATAGVRRMLGVEIASAGGHSATGPFGRGPFGRPAGRQA